MMKLISCHIENFGAISQSDFEFSDGLTQFCQANGWGKSTLAAFLKAMFYGLPAAKTNSKFNDRIHYFPFSGGKFGGNLTFTAGGKTYRIERFFDKKSEVADELKVYVNGVPSSEFDKRAIGDRTIGEIIFELDEQSFARTAFITSDCAEMRSTDGISAKLNGGAGAFGDQTDAVAAKNALDKAAKNLKMRGGKGEITAQEEEIVRLKASISDVQKIADSLEEKYGEYNRLTARIAELDGEERERNRREVELGKWARYDDMCAAVAAQRAELSALSEKYPKGLPNADEINALVAESRTRTQLSASVRAESFSPVKDGRLRELSALFSGGVPDEQELKGVGASIEKLRELNDEQIRLSSAQDDKFSSLEARFGGKIPSGQTLEGQRGRLREYELARRELLELSEQPAATVEKRINIPAALSAAVATACVVGGAALLSVRLMAAAILLAAGGLCSVAAAILFIKGKTDRGAASSNAQSASVKARMNAAEDEIRAFLVPYGVYSSDVVHDFKKFEEDLNEYAALSAEIVKRRERLSVVRAEEEGEREELKNYFSAYGFSDGNFAEDLAVLRAFVGEYARLNGEKLQSERARVEIEEHLAATDARISSALKKYGIADGEDRDEIISSVQRDEQSYSRLLQEAAQGEERAERFKSENRLTVRPEPVKENDCSEELKRSRTREAALNREISEAEAIVETHYDRQNRLENAQERLSDLKEKYSVYVAARDAIKRAEDRLNDAYVAPVKAGFTEYARIIEKFTDAKIVMDKDFALSFENGGELRSDEYLSAGQRAACSLCFRLALIDKLYANEKPFIIMDDPFVDLDGESLKSAKKLLKELAKNVQIIYFCCHESRKVSE